MYGEEVRILSLLDCDSNVQNNIDGEFQDIDTYQFRLVFFLILIFNLFSVNILIVSENA